MVKERKIHFRAKKLLIFIKMHIHNKEHWIYYILYTIVKEHLTFINAHFLRRNAKL